MPQNNMDNAQQQILALEPALVPHIADTELQLDLQLGHMDDRPNDGRDKEVTGNYVPKMVIDRQNEAVRDFPSDGAIAAASSLIGATVTAPQALLPV